MDFVNTAKKVVAKAFPNSSKLRTITWVPLLEEWRNENEEVRDFEDRYKLYNYINEKKLATRTYAT